MNPRCHDCSKKIRTEADLVLVLVFGKTLPFHQACHKARRQELSGGQQTKK